MSSRCKLVSPSSRGARAGSGQRSGRQQHPSVSQRNAYVEAQEQNGRLRVLNATLRNQNTGLARELNEVKSMLQISRQKERETGRRLLQQETAARSRRPAITRSFSTDDVRPRLAADRNPPTERGEKQGGCAARAGVSKEHQGTETGQTRQSRRGVSRACHGVDSGRVVDENTDHPPPGTSEAWLGTIARPRPVAATPVSPSTASPDTEEVHLVPKEAPAVKKGARRSSIVPNSAIANQRSSQPCATPPLLAEPAAERLPATPIQPIPERGSLLSGATARNSDDAQANAKERPQAGVLAPIQRIPERGSSRLLSYTTVRNRDAAHANVTEHPQAGVLLAGPAEEADTEPDAESSQQTTPSHVEYEYCSPDTRTVLRHHAADDSSSFYSRSPGQLISPSSYSQSASATGAAGRAGARGGGSGDLQEEYFGAAPVETARSDRGQQHCIPWVPPASSSQLTSEEVTAQPSTSSRPRRSVARPLSYQEPSLNIKMRKGHVMFPTAKARAARSKSPEKAAGEIEKENGRGSSSDDGGRK